MASRKVIESVPLLGASFSLHRAAELGVDKKRLFRAALTDLGLRRLRLMSYWNIHENLRGNYDFSELDWQLDMAAKYGASVSLCVGKRQPRWPECHIPEWAARLPAEEWYDALYKYIEVVVKRYKNHPALNSWQLENEALLKDFGYCPDGDYNRERLRKELAIIKKLDRKHPVIMTLSDSWGLPVKKPDPDLYGCSLYRITINRRGKYAYSSRPALFYRLRNDLIGILKGAPVFIHELQAEPWLNQALLERSPAEQLRYMNADTLKDNIEYALKTGLRPIDLWGLEWWYYLKVKHKNPTLWDAVKSYTVPKP